MQILTSALLVAALLAGQTLAASLLAREEPNCSSEDNFDPRNSPSFLSPCTGLGHNAYKCDSGALVVIKPSQIVLRAGKADSKVMVSCGPNGDFATLYHCKAGHGQSFSSNCYSEQVHFVQNASEL
ncbi:hypothetical protein EsDP_00003750 [Epichloe bromicola]|uniref:Uncharacterized protein n=1 Tax=Epichloe bromicola TaxID=79588 RepID=A0ABQ0CPN8_9HYPO